MLLSLLSRVCCCRSQEDPSKHNHHSKHNKSNGFDEEDKALDKKATKGLLVRKKIKKKYLTDKNAQKSNDIAVETLDEDKVVKIAIVQKKVIQLYVQCIYFTVVSNPHVIELSPPHFQQYWRQFGVPTILKYKLNRSLQEFGQDTTQFEADMAKRHIFTIATGRTNNSFKLYVYGEEVLFLFVVCNIFHSNMIMMLANKAQTMACICI